MSATLHRPVLRYHGGKWKLAPWIISHFPPHRIYVEPFGGAASVLMRKPRCYAEIYNDQWSVVVNIFRVLRNPTTAAELERQLRLTPFSREEFEQDYPDESTDPVERARSAILRSFAGFGSASTNGDHRTGFRANSNRSHTTPAHDWANYPNYIGSFVERLSGVVIENRDAIDVVRRHDSEQTLTYCDPPYPHSVRNMDRGNAAYAVESSDQYHCDLAAALHECAGMVVVSSYPGALYNDLYGDWERREIQAFADGARPRTEVLWMNKACSVRQSQARLFA